MNAADKRILSAIALLFIFALALYLRLYGIDWAFKDGVATPHPDERHYDSCAGVMGPKGLTTEERQLPWRDQLQLLYERNLKVDPNRQIGDVRQGPQGLRPINYNYGTFPLHLYMLYKAYLISQSTKPGEWIFLPFDDWLSLICILFVLFLGIQLYRAIYRDFRTTDRKNIPWYKDPRPLMYFFPSLILPFLGLVLVIVLPTSLNNFQNYNTQTATLLLVGRVLTAWMGAFTVLLAYLIGRDAYNRTAGLLAAAMLATAMLHVQTSHFATVDVIVGFWSTAAVYCCLKVSQKPRLIWYLLGAVCMGFGVATKWSGVTLPGILWLAHAIATWGDERQGKTGRWIHTVWLLIAALVMLHFFKAASSLYAPDNPNIPALHLAMAQLRDFYLNYKWLLLAGFILIFIASLVLLYLRNTWHAGEIGWFKPALQIYRPWLWLALSIPVGVFCFFLAQPMAYFDAPEFARSLAEQQRIIVTGEPFLVVYTLQYRHTPGIFYFLDNLFYPSLDWITAFFVVAGTLYAIGRVFIRGTASDLLLVAWVVPSFLLYGTFHAKFPRYLDTILPVMVVFGGRLLADLITIRPYFYLPAWPTATVGMKRLARGFGYAGATLALLCGLIYGWSYIGIYDQPHTLVYTGTLVRQFAPPGSKITQNNWDEGFGVHVENRDALGIHDRYMDDQNPDKRAQYLAEMLERFDYIVLPSKRGYGTTLQNPDFFPITNQFIRALFAEQLGFRVAKVIENYPKFLGWEFRTDAEDETADIYDHPKVIIFEKFQSFTPEQLKSLILNPPDWVNEITKNEILTLRDGYPVFYRPQSFPILRWWLIVQVLGILAFVMVFPLCTPLPDRGYAVAKIIGLALFSWICWLLASLHWFPLSQYQMAFVFVLLCIAASWVGARWRKELAEYLKRKWPLLLSYELLFIALWSLFLLIRIQHPAAVWGEKPMNFSFINAVYRTDTFPPEDPWIAQYGINYYYYGQAIFSIVGRFIGLEPSYLFNIAGTSVSALIGLGVFSLVYALCRRVLISLLATYLCLFAGHIISYLRLAQFSLDKDDLTFSESLRGFFNLIPWMFQSAKVYLGLLSPELIKQLPPDSYESVIWNKMFHASYDRVFWPTGHNVIFGTAANEFPYWMHLFLDFHAHMLVIPFVFAYMTLLYVLFVRPQKEMSAGILGGFAFFLALLLGTITCTNTWDLPTCLIALLMVGALKFWRESELIHNPIRTAWLSPSTGQSLLRLPLGPVILIAALSIIFLYPFHSHFVSRVNSVRIMTEGQTPVLTYLGFWGHLLFPILVGILLFMVIRRDGQISLFRTVLASGIFIVILICAVLVNLFNPFGFPYSGVPNAPPMDFRTAGLFLPFLVMLFLVLWQRWREPTFVFACLLGFLGLGLSLGIEFFYVWENWSIPNHRWNTSFKFNLQVWHYLSIFAALCVLYVWRILHDIGQNIHRAFTLLTRGTFVAVTMVLLMFTVPFAVIAPWMVTKTGGAAGRDARGFIPNLDGLTWLRKESPESYVAVLWLNRFVPGTPNIVEMVNSEYGIFSRFCTNTGLPALLGWAHHVGERIHYNNERDVRRQMADLVYIAPEKETVLPILGRYNIEYLIFGELEMKSRRGDKDRFPPYGEDSLDRFEKWGDVFRLVYRYGDTSIFRIDQSLNPVYGIQSQMEAQQQLPPALRPPEPTVSMFEGMTQAGQVIFAEPRGIAVDAQGKVYVADSFNHKLQCFNPDGSRAWQVGKKGQGKNEFNELNDVAIDPSTGNMYVTDTWNQRVVVLNPMGEVVSHSAVSLYGPRGIAFHPQLNMIYIADTGNDQVVVMTPEGEQIARWGTLQGGTGDKDFREPVGIDITPDGNVIVVDSMNHRLSVYKPDTGDLVRSWSFQSDATPPGKNFEGHVACAPDGKVYLSDPNEGSVHVYTAAGELLEKLTTDANGVRMMIPVGIAITPQGEILVSDRSMNRIHRLRPAQVSQQLDTGGSQ